jgi:Tol biopolymer transport system component
LISANGRFVVFASSGSNLVPDSGGAGIFLRDTCIGVSGCQTGTIRVSVGESGSIPANDLFEFAMSGNGRFVAFTSSAADVVPGDTNASIDVFVRDTCFGAPTGCTPSTTRVSLANDGTQAAGDSHVNSLSEDGRVVAFTSSATNLVANDTSPFPKIFVRDTCAGISSGCTPSTIRLSVALDSTAANNQSPYAAVSADGAFLAFSSLASNLAPGDTNQAYDVFVARTGLP